MAPLIKPLPRKCEDQRSDSQNLSENQGRCGALEAEIREDKEASWLARLVESLSSEYNSQTLPHLVKEGVIKKDISGFYTHRPTLAHSHT